MAAEDESQQELTLVSLALDSIPMTVFNSSPVATSGAAAADRGDGGQPTVIEAAATPHPTKRSQMMTAATTHHEIDATAAAGATATSPHEEREAVLVPERRSRRFLRKVSVALPFLLSALVLYIYYIYVVHVCSKRRLFPFRPYCLCLCVLLLLFALYYSLSLFLFSSLSVLSSFLLPSLFFCLIHPSSNFVKDVHCLCLNLYMYCTLDGCLQETIPRGCLQHVLYCSLAVPTNRMRQKA